MRKCLKTRLKSLKPALTRRKCHPPAESSRFPVQGLKCLVENMLRAKRKALELMSEFGERDRLGCRVRRLAGRFWVLLPSAGRRTGHAGRVRSPLLSRFHSCPISQTIFSTKQVQSWRALPSSIRAFSRAVRFCQYSITPSFHFLTESCLGQAKARKSRLGQTMQKRRNSLAINHQHSTINYFGQGESSHYLWHESRLRGWEKRQPQIAAYRFRGKVVPWSSHAKSPSTNSPSTRYSAFEPNGVKASRAIIWSESSLGFQPLLRHSNTPTLRLVPYSAPLAQNCVSFKLAGNILTKQSSYSTI
jgi:hypothetical protein